VDDTIAGANGDKHNSETEEPPVEAV
jgi:hypothetical protein